MKRSFLLIGLLTLVGSCSQLAMVSPDVIRIAVPRNLSGLLVLVAQKENYFADLGLRVEVVAKDSNEAAYKELENAKVDLAVTDTTSIAFGDNAKIKILSEVYSSSRGMFLLLPDSKVKTLNGLKGMSILVPPKSSEEWFMHLMSIAEGLDLNNNTIVAKTDISLTKKRAPNEAIVARNVELAKVMTDLGIVEAAIFSSRAHIEISLVAASEDFKNNPKEDSNRIERFLMALSRAEQRIYKHPNKGEDVLLQFIPELDTKSVKNILSGSLFRVGLSNTLYVLLSEQTKWVRTRYQRRNQLGGLNIRNAMVPDYLRSISAGSVTLSDDLLEAIQ